MGEQGFVELKIGVEIPRQVYDFLRDFYALSGETVEEVVAKDTENIVVDWAFGYEDDASVLRHLINCL